MTEIYLNIVEEIPMDTKSTEYIEEAPEAVELSIQKSDIVRIEESVHVSWSGVSGCNHQDTVDNNAKTAMESWVKAKMFEHRNWRWVKYGAGVGNFRCSQRKDPWTSVRSCGCSGHIPCYIEFRKA